MSYSPPTPYTKISLFLFRSAGEDLTQKMTHLTSLTEQDLFLVLSCL